METILSSHSKRQRKVLRFIIAFTIAIAPFLAMSQENPWTYKQSENPWGTTTKETKSTEVVVSPRDTFFIVTETDSSSIQNERIAIETDTTVVQKEQTVNEVTKPITISSNSTPTQTQEVRKVNLAGIEWKAKDEYNAGVALALSIPSILFPPVTFPILIASVFVPTIQQESMIDQYKLDNPKATEAEIKALKRGIRKKRAQRTAGGAGIGLAAGILGLLIIL